MTKTSNRNADFGKKIRNLRKSRHMSQEEFAIALGAGSPSDRSRNLSSMVSGWERGDREPSLQTVCKITQSFGVTSDWLLGLKPDFTDDFSEELYWLVSCCEDTLSRQDKQRLIKLIKAFLDIEGEVCKYGFAKRA